MNKQRKLFAAAISIGLAACAPYASDVAPTVDTSRYDGLGCAEVHTRLVDTGAERDWLAHLQDQAATDDVWAVAFLGFPVSAPDGADRHKLAVLKGQFDALERAFAACEYKRLS